MAAARPDRQKRIASRQSLVDGPQFFLRGII